MSTKIKLSSKLEHVCVFVCAYKAAAIKRRAQIRLIKGVHVSITVYTVPLWRPFPLISGTARPVNNIHTTTGILECHQHCCHLSSTYSNQLHVRQIIISYFTFNLQHILFLSNYAVQNLKVNLVEQQKCKLKTNINNYYFK